MTPSYNANLTPPANSWGAGPDGRAKMMLPDSIMQMLQAKQNGQSSPITRGPTPNPFAAMQGGAMPTLPASATPTPSQVTPGSTIMDTIRAAQGGPAGGMMAGGQGGAPGGLAQDGGRFQPMMLSIQPEIQTRPDMRGLDGLLPFLNR